jgi:hypothetical protein
MYDGLSPFLVQAILGVDFNKFNLEMLQSLVSIAPNSDEMSALEAFAGKRTHLAEVERFLVEMTDVPNLKQRLER